MEYNIIDDMKKIKSNVSIVDLCSIPQQRKLKEVIEDIE
jgi:hypothetical protein